MNRLASMLIPDFAPMGERDLPAVAALEASVQPFPWSQGHFDDSLKAGHSCWICRVGGDLVAFSVVMPALDEAHLLNIGVSTACQGRGLGARMMLQSMAVSLSNGATSMYLEVRPSNLRALKLYRQLGFAEIGLRRAYYPAQVGREDGLVFKKELS